MPDELALELEALEPEPEADWELDVVAAGAEDFVDEDDEPPPHPATSSASASSAAQATRRPELIRVVIFGLHDSRARSARGFF